MLLSPGHQFLRRGGIDADAPGRGEVSRDRGQNYGTRDFRVAVALRICYAPLRDRRFPSEEARGLGSKNGQFDTLCSGARGRVFESRRAYQTHLSSSTLLTAPSNMSRRFGQQARRILRWQKLGSACLVRTAARGSTSALRSACQLNQYDLPTVQLRNS